MKSPYVFTFDDYLESARIAAHKQRKWFRLYAIAGIAAIAISSLSIVEMLPVAVPASVLALFGFIVLVFPIWASYENVKRSWDSQSGELQTEFEVDESGLRIYSPAITYHFRWNAFSSHQETSRLFYLRRGEKILCMIPKRGLADEQVKSLRALISDSILEKSLGFPVVQKG